MIKRAIIAINKTVNIITQYNTSHYTCQPAGKRRRGYICLCPALWRGKHIQRKGAYQRYWPHRDLCRSTDYNWNRVQMVENIEYWSDSFLVPENHIVSKFLHQNLTRKEASASKMIVQITITFFVPESLDTIPFLNWVPWPGIVTWLCVPWWQQSYWGQFPGITKLNGVYFPLETICRPLFTGSSPTNPQTKVFNWAAKYLLVIKHKM